jgi:hypothetical protein
MIVTIFLGLAGLYLLCGIIFAVPFAIVGVGKIDPHAANASWGFRLLILPGSTLLWPLLAKRWFRGIHEPPEEKTAHRLKEEYKTQPGERPEAEGARTAQSLGFGSAILRSTY